MLTTPCYNYYTIGSCCLGCNKIPRNYIHPQNFTKVTKFTVMNNYPCMVCNCSY